MSRLDIFFPCYLLSNHVSFFINYSSIGIAIRPPVKVKEHLIPRPKIEKEGDGN
jgi:hypothetical protein